ncbi:IS21 family transposase [Lacrimispora defluvii]|uniref:IS21 family transposase n=1 Tax=Lacrimispora defluvii TaxID=2719233 RepID=UPI001A9ADFAE|nr:IS21 family transposase [Lacrimispora defluvii]
MIETIKAELNILRCLNMKPNYSDLARKYGVSRQTISKYDKGFEKKETRNRKSKLDKYREEIEEKINLAGATITGVYKYFYSKDKTIGTRSNFDYYIRKHKLRSKNKSVVHPRYETKPGEQLQFDFKEDITMTSRNGEIFKFNIFTTTLGYSRMHKFTYSKSKTKEDVFRCLIEAFKYYGGVPKRLLTDNMSSIINVKTKKFTEEFRQFAKDFNFTPEKCNVRSPQTKGKVESANRFISRLVPYNYEFENEEELIEIINRLSDEVNNEINQTTRLKPIMLIKKEKEYLSPLPNKEIIESYLNYMKPTTVHNDSMIYYKGKRYSVPHKFINKILKVRELDNKLYIYNNTDLIRIHPLTQKIINYHEDDYKKIMAEKISFRSEGDIEAFTIRNLEILDNLKG